MLPVGGHLSEGFLSIAEDSRGQIWICGDLGLALWTNGTWHRYTKRDGLKADMVSQIALDADGSAWIGYRDAFGITHLKTGTGQYPTVDHVTMANGLRSEKTLFLGFDNRGWLWAGSDHGVDVFDGTRWRHYGRSDGLIWDDCNSHAFMADADGSIWIGTSKGLSRFMPQAAPQSAVPPPVVFTSVKFGDQFLDPVGKLNIPYADGTLQVRFAALTFVQNSNVVFRYRMAGVETRWLETTQRELNYPQLGPGMYTLEVSARNAQGVWSAEPARLNFQIDTPWWLTWWFRAACLLGALILSRRMWLRRTHRMEAERHRLEIAVAQRTKELSLEKQRVLEEKARAEQENLVVQRQNREIERLLTEARQASKFKSEFLANMSHEIRTPMNGILGMTDMVLATALSSEQREYLETARFSADSLLTILNDILDFSKIEAGRLDLHPIEFSLRECVTQTGKMFLVPLSAKGLQFDTEISDEVPDRIVGDPDRLRQVLLNLIGNAVKFTHQGGIKVIVRCSLPDGRVSMNGARKQADEAKEPAAPEERKVCLQFVVQDTGIGIPADKQQLIFEAFRQADGSTTRKYGGTGLGLAICSRLVELMGGSIHVESRADEGSEFIFTAIFGVVAEAAEAPPSELPRLAADVEPAEPERMRSLHVLLAEDNVVNQRLATRLLEKRGHRVVLASTGGEALARLKQGIFDVILMDVQMPDMDGLETTAIIREREKDSGIRTPIVALTAHTMKGDRERCLAAGMDGYVTKPINAAEFMATVETVANIAFQTANQA
jgi:signal transduction histidine kinase/CheY-like chemotaxis protein